MNEQIANAAVEPQAKKTRILNPWPRRELKQLWTADLYNRLWQHIGENASSGSKASWRYSVKSMLICAEQVQLPGERDLTPAWLGGFRRQKISLKRERDDRNIFGRLLVKLGVWSENDYELFVQVLENSLSRWQAARQSATPFKYRRPSSNPPPELCGLVSALALQCGLSIGEMQGLRVRDVNVDGLVIRAAYGMRVRPLRLIPFGNTRDQLPHEVLKQYLAAESPIDYLLFSKSPRDHRKPASKQTLNVSVKMLHPKSTPGSLREQHFRDDFNSANSLCELRFHWRNVHGLSNGHVHKLICGGPGARGRGNRSPAIKGLVNEASVFPVPAPYFLAAICASWCIPTQSTILQGGKRCSSSFHGLLGRYDITVEWPISLFHELKGKGEKAARALRLLYKLGWEHWFRGRKIKISHAEREDLWREERDLLDRFASTNVRVIDGQQARDWSGPLFESQGRKQGFTVPLIEAMTGGAWRSKCKSCWHPLRTAIDRDTLATLATISHDGGVVQRLSAIAEKFGGGLSYQSLRRHAGLTTPVPGRGNTQRSHIATASPAALAKCRRALVDRLASLARLSLIFYGLLLATGADEQEFSVAWFGKQVGLSVSDHEISVALNALSTGEPALITDFQKTPQGFLVRR